MPTPIAPADSSATTSTGDVATAQEEAAKTKSAADTSVELAKIANDKNNYVKVKDALARAIV